MSSGVASKRKRKSDGNGSITTYAHSGKKKKPDTFTGSDSGRREGDNGDDSAEEEHCKLLGLVTGQMKRLPLQEGPGEGGMEEDHVGMPKKRKRRGERKGDVTCAGIKKEMGGSVDQESASEYLTLWDTDRCKWSFKKKTQYWLLQNMYDKQKVCDPQEECV